MNAKNLYGRALDHVARKIESERPLDRYTRYSMAEHRINEMTNIEVISMLEELLSEAQDEGEG